MSIYPPPIRKHFLCPRNAGSPKPGSSVGTGISFVCGCLVRLSLEITESDQAITNANFTTNGCGFAVAAADVIAGNLDGMKLAEMHGGCRDQIIAECEAQLGRFPIDRRHCVEMAAEALQNALADHRSRRLIEFQGEKALICTCFGVTEEVIVDLIRKTRADEVEEISDLCRAGSGCGSCQMMIRELIETSKVEDY